MDSLWSPIDAFGESESNSFGSPIDLTTETVADSDDVLSCDDLTPTIPASAVQFPVVIDLTNINTRGGASSVDLRIHNRRENYDPAKSHTVVDGCNSLRQVISHWKNCTDGSCCRCGQLRARLQELSIRKRPDTQVTTHIPVSIPHQILDLSSACTHSSADTVRTAGTFSSTDTPRTAGTLGSADTVRTAGTFSSTDSPRTAGTLGSADTVRTDGTFSSTDTPRTAGTLSSADTTRTACTLTSADTARTAGTPSSADTLRTTNVARNMTSTDITEIPQYVRQSSAFTVVTPRDPVEATPMNFLQANHRFEVDTSMRRGPCLTNQQTTSNNGYISTLPIVCGIGSQMTHGLDEYQPAYEQSAIQTQNPVTGFSRYIPTPDNEPGLQTTIQDSSRALIQDFRTDDPQLLPRANTQTRWDAGSAQTSCNAFGEPRRETQENQMPIPLTPIEPNGSFVTLHTGSEPPESSAFPSSSPSFPTGVGPRRGRRGTSVPRWCRYEGEIRVYLTCLRDPRTYSVRNMDMAELQQLGLGVAFHEAGTISRGYSILFTDWDSTEVDEYIRDVFPALRQTSFHLCTARPYGRIQRLPIECRSGLQLREHFLSENRRTPPNIYIRPDIRLTETDLQQAVDLRRQSPDPDDLRGLPVDTYMDNAGDASDDETSYFERIIHIKRTNIIRDMLAAFKDPTIVHRRVRIVLEDEEAEDAGGVFRDILSEFWTKFMDSYFEGENQAVPRINSEIAAESWAAVGRILYRGYSQEKYLPLRFCMASLAYSVAGDSEDMEVMMLDSFLEYLPVEERSVLKKALQISQFPAGFSDRLVDELIDILSRFGMRSIPNPDNIRNTALRSAEIALFETPYFPLHQMNLSQLKDLKDFSSVLSIEILYKRMKPDGSKVSELFVVNQSNYIHQTILSYLKRAVESFSEDLVSRFLRFVTGSDIMNGRKIDVEFVHVAGLERRFVAHTCGPSLDVPVTFQSYEEFLSELQTQLLSDHWEMDFV